MSPSDSGTDLDSNFGIPGSLTDTTDSPEPQYERPRVTDSVNSHRATRRELSTLLLSITGLDFYLLLQYPSHCCPEFSECWETVIHEGQVGESPTRYYGCTSRTLRPTICFPEAEHA